MRDKEKTFEILQIIVFCAAFFIALVLINAILNKYDNIF